MISLSPSPPSAIQCWFIVRTQIALCNYTHPYHPSVIFDSPKIDRPSPQIAPSTHQSQSHFTAHDQQSSEESPQPFYNHRLCCEHQFTDRCSEHGEPYPPVQLTSTAGPNGASCRPLHLATTHRQHTPMYVASQKHVMHAHSYCLSSARPS